MQHRLLVHRPHARIARPLIPLSTPISSDWHAHNSAMLHTPSTQLPITPIFCLSVLESFLFSGIQKAALPASIAPATQRKTGTNAKNSVINQIHMPLLLSPLGLVSESEFGRRALAEEDARYRLYEGITIY